MITRKPLNEKVQFDLPSPDMSPRRRFRALTNLLAKERARYRAYQCDQIDKAVKELSTPSTPVVP